MVKAEKDYKKAFQVLVFVGLSALLCACAKPESTTPEAPAAIAQPILPAAEPPRIDVALKLPAPKPAEIQGAIKRIYKDAVTIDANQFIVGDFNGDSSQDVAVVVKPAMGKLEVINSEVANWILEDPQKIPLPDPTKRVQQLPPAPPPVRVEMSDTLIAILHGYGQDGWRAPEAIQTYLLKNAVGKNMLQQEAKALINNVKLAKKLPRLRGDVIQETLDGKPGFLYYTGAKYVWHRTNEN
jgi:hypothetical protein